MLRTVSHLIRTSSCRNREGVHARLASSLSRVVTTRGVDFHVEQYNPDAPHPVLCLAGSLGTARTDFGVQLDNGLGGDNTFGIVAFDPRGLGKSNSVRRDYPLDFYERDALDAHAIMTDLGYSKYSVLGWSDGAITALHLAANESTKENVQRLVVWGGNAFISQEDIDAWEAVRDVRSSWSDRMRTERAAALGDDVDELQRLNNEATDAYQDIFLQRGGDICLEALHKISCPTLVVHGAKDVICDMKHAKYIARQIPDASLTVIPEGKHNLHLRHADEFHQIVCQFLTTDDEATEEDEIQPAIDDIAYAFMGSKALFVALGACVFDAIDLACKENEASDMSPAASTASFEQVENGCSGVKGERLRTLLSACVALRLIKRKISRGNDVYSLPKASRDQLCRSSRRYWGDYITGQVDSQFYQRMGELDETMVSGNAASHGYEVWFEDPDAASKYTRAQHNGSLATGFALWKRLPDVVAQYPNMRVLDVGGGSGAFSIATARILPEATAVVLDLPNVVKVAEDIVAQEDQSIQRRISTLALSANDPGEWRGVVPDGSFDVVLMSYVSGSIPATALPSLYANAFAALRPGGNAIIHDFFVDNSGEGPKSAALWALAHVTVNPEGMGLQPKRIINMLCKEGFIAPKVSDLIPGATQVVVATKPLLNG